MEEGSSGEAEGVGKGKNDHRIEVSEPRGGNGTFENHLSRKLGGGKTVPPQISQHWNLGRCKQRATVLCSYF